MGRMVEIRIHGRGGQGGVTAARMLADSAHRSGWEDVQAFPFFGPERRGAPVEAYMRISDERIDRRSQIYRPDYVLVLASSLMEVSDVSRGIKEGGWLVVNGEPSEFDFKDLKVAAVDATKLAQEEGLEAGGILITSVPMIGGVARIIGLDEGAVAESIREELGEKLADRNVRAARRAYRGVKMEDGQ